MIENKDIVHVGELVRMLNDEDESLAYIPATALLVMKVLANQHRAVDERLAKIDQQIET